MKRFILSILLLFISQPVFAATYYVAITGSDSNPGTQASPWRNPQKCTESPVAAGDTCLVGDGTYTQPGTNGLVVWAQTVFGTASMPITIKSLNPLGARIIVPGGSCTSPTTCSNEGFHISRSYFVIDGFDITQTSSTGSGSGVANHGVKISGAAGIIIRNNDIHDIGRLVCSTSGFGFTGVFVGPTGSAATNIRLSNNLLRKIGRLRVGEGGCSSSVALDQNDHGFYIDNAATIKIDHNLCYDTNRGYCVQFFGGTVSNITLEHNTFVGGSPVSLPAGQVVFGGTITGVNTIRNNLSYQAKTATFETTGGLNVPVGSSIAADHNFSDKTDSDMFVTALPARVTSVSNIVNTNPNFINASANDYRLAGTSAAINAGVDIAYPFNGTAPDIGVFETPRFSTCSVESGDANTLRVTFQNSYAPPLLPTSSITGFTSRKNSLNNPISGSQRTGTNRIDFTLGSAISGGDLVDVNVASTNLSDSASVGSTFNQLYVQGLTNQPCTNNVAGGTTFVLTQAVFRFNGLRGTEAAPIATPYAAAPENTNVYVVPGGSVRLRIGIKNSVATAPPTGFIPRYRLGGGTLTIIPDTFGNDKIAFCGTSPDPDVPITGTPTTKQLSGSGSFSAGQLLRTSNAVPTITLAPNGITEMEYCLTFAPNASLNAIYDFYLTQQDGTNLVYNVIPKATITGSQVGMGF